MMERRQKSLLLCILSLLLVQEAARFVVASEGDKNGPRIFISPNDSVFTIDSSNPGSKVLTCQTSGDKPSMFGALRWSGPGRTDNWKELSQRHKIYEEDNSNSWVLEFIKPTVDDSGVYYCHGTYQESDVHNVSISVKVYTPIKLENCPDRQFLVEGSTDGRISCRITGDLPKINLSKNNMPIDHFNNRYKGDNDGGLIINGAVDKSDAGVYAIRVKSSITGELKNHYITVEVHSKPEILTVDNSDLAGVFTGIEYEQAQLECKVAGNPKPLVLWYDPKLRNLTSVGGYIVNQEKGTLTINRVSKLDDHGEFTCEAYNTIGKTSRKVSMTVQTKPHILSFDNKTVDEGSEVTFECRSSGNPPPTFSIRKAGNNQTPYKPGDGIVRDVDTVSEGGGSDVVVHRLKIVASKANFGLHYCQAANKAGTVEKSALLLVNHKPDLSRTPAEQFVKMGQKFTVTCHIRAYPAPIVSWWSDNTQIINVDSSMKTSPDGDVHVVTMMPPAIQQTAFNRYVCIAENKMGRSNQTIIPRYTTTPGVVVAELLERKPTIIKVRLSVPNDGGDRIRLFKYRAEGKTLDMHYPYYNYQEDRHNETTIQAQFGPSAEYTIRNLFPFYRYKFAIRALNDNGEGDWTEFSVETTKPTEPEPPVIVTPGLSTSPGSEISSEYSNGYLLKWSPPELDNGDPVTRYIIKCFRIISDSLVSDSSLVEERVVEQMNERPLHAKLGPLETNSRYKIQIQARNKYGDSQPAQITIRVVSDRPLMPDLEAQSLAWLGQTSTPTLAIVIASALLLLIIIEVVFSLMFQVGISRYLFKSAHESYHAEV